MLFKILCAQLYNNGSRQYINVFTYELFVQENIYQNKNSGTLQSSIVTGRAWNQIIVFNLNQAFDKSRSNVTKIFTSSNIGI